MLAETVVVYMTKKALHELTSRGEIKADFNVEEAARDLGEDLAVTLIVRHGPKILKAIAGEEAYRTAVDEGKFVLAVTAAGAAYVAASPVLMLAALFTPWGDAEPIEYDRTSSYAIW
jgi:hypothetical protein